jgi:hypothetical protein
MYFGVRIKPTKKVASPKPKISTRFESMMNLYYEKCIFQSVREKEKK